MTAVFFPMSLALLLWYCTSSRAIYSAAPGAHINATAAVLVALFPYLAPFLLPRFLPFLCTRLRSLRLSFLTFVVPFLSASDLTYLLTLFLIIFPCLLAPSCQLLSISLPFLASSLPSYGIRPSLPTHLATGKERERENESERERERKRTRTREREREADRQREGGKEREENDIQI